MAIYKGSCHCGAIEFEVSLELHTVTECNCSICFRKGGLYVPAEPHQLRILRGKGTLALYQFGAKVAKHYFCKRCGIHPFHRPRIAPARWAVNVRCLEGVDVARLKHVLFDGQNWEAAASRLHWE